MSITSALRKLEEETGVGRRCLRCRVHYIRFGEEIRHTPSADLFVSTCSECGQTLKLIHTGFTERERAVLVSLISDQTTQGDAAKWVASYAWTRHLPRFVELKAAGAAEEKRLRAAAKDPEARRRVKVLDEYAAHKERVTAAAATPEVPPDWHKVIDALDKVREQRSAPVSALKDELLFSYAVMARMEVFMWGAESEETQRLAKARCDEMARESAELIERLERERLEREERERQRQERNRREREERERAYQERERERAEREASRLAPPVYQSAGPSGTSEPPRSRFRVDPMAPVPHNPMVIDPTAAHVPEPARMVVPDPADPSRQLIVTGDVGPDIYDPKHPDAVQFQRSEPEKLPDHQKYYRGEYYDGDRRY